MSARIALLLFLGILAGCAATPGAPTTWPVTAATGLVGKCPDIAGKYKNEGSRHPGDARPMLLSQFLGIDGAETVEVRQSPDAITFRFAKPGGKADELTFTTGETAGGWERKPNSFLCPLDLASGRRTLYFSFQGSQSISVVSPLLIAHATAFRWYRAADGALIVNVTDTSGVLVAFVPAGKSERVWYRYAPAA